MYIFAKSKSTPDLPRTTLWTFCEDVAKKCNIRHPRVQ